MYPTKTQIMEKEQKFKPITIITIKKWKKNDWYKHKNDKSIYRLLNKLSHIYDKPLNITNLKTNSHYSPTTKTINLHNTSIITALHEFAHHLYGRNETKACQWSIWLFKKTFPKNFNKLKWNGHMLIK